MSENSKVIIYLDDETSPIGAFDCPVKFSLDTTKIQDGNHVLKMISKNIAGKEGIRLIPFVVRNGPEISVDGLKENSVVDGEVPILINAHGKNDQLKFVVEGSETPRSVPSWVWALLISFVGWAAYYTISSLV